jgi:hypothetical protein
MYNGRTMRVLASCAIIVAAGGAVVGCSSGASSSGTGSQSTGGASTGAAASPSSAQATTSGSAACDTTPWRSAPVTVTHQVAVPPVPVIAAVRVAQHPECGYDRIVLDVRGPLPGYSVSYVQQVVADPSGRAVTMPGARYLVITLRPAQAHSAAGAVTVTSGIHTPAFPALASWTVAGDFEGVVRIALGLAGPAHIRTGELGGRIYIDVKE